MTVATLVWSGTETARAAGWPEPDNTGDVGVGCCRLTPGGGFIIVGVARMAGTGAGGPRAGWLEDRRMPGPGAAWLEERRRGLLGWSGGGPGTPGWLDLLRTFTNSNSEDSREPPFPCGGVIWVDIVIISITVVMFWSTVSLSVSQV